MDDEVSYQQAAGLPGVVLSTGRYAAFRFEPHYHLECHVGLISAGVQRQSARGESLYLTRGTINLVPAGEVHDGVAATDGAYTLHTFRLSSELLAGLGEELSGRQGVPTHAATLLHDPALAERLLRMHALLGQSASDELLHEACLLEVFEALFSRFLKPVPPASGRTLPLKSIDRVREFAQASLADKIVLDDLARMVDLDRFSFLRLFKRTIGMTPHAWLLRLRLERAVELLRQGGDRPITEIAHAVGFFDQSHFNRAFRQAYGVTPSRLQAMGGNFLQAGTARAR